ncbi:Uncharacterised protein [Listeria grayi]|uniref:Uncharacterized protein n=1 Tax=Listeria grayi TaxID=1641 RepID=A0A378MGM7_LISGR|nr:hypothetical protein [Listeria grayi]STY45431.1 Uncharacterised protein [Listeria grayi]VEI32329.1 Uncharacterised protein [Listeria grayi]
MEIKVQEKLSNGRVQFVSAYGECIGVWADEEPEPGRKYTIKVTVPDKVSVEALQESDEKHCMLEADDEGVFIVGQLEDYEEDGFAVLRLEESIIGFDTNFSEEVERLHGKFIELTVPKIIVENVGN